MRTYGAILPSSLATVLSLTLASSAGPPVSVLVRAVYASLEAFPGSRLLVLRYSLKLSLTLHDLDPVSGFAWIPPASLGPQSIKGVTFTVSVTPSLHIRVQESAPAFHPLRLSASR